MDPFTFPIFSVKQRFLLYLTFCVVHLQFRESTSITCRAVVVNSFGGPDVMKLQNISIPSFLENQVLVKVKAAGIVPVDAHIRSGSYPVKPKLPYVPGKEIAGIVEDTHDTVQTFKPGDKIFCGIDNGGYAEYAVANEYDCFPLPKNMTFAQGAAIYTTYFTIYRGLIPRGHLRRGDSLLIHDSSGILGVAAIEVSKYIGAIVIACTTVRGIENVLKQIGADHVVYKSQNGYLQWALNKINRRGFNLILELFPHFDLEFDKQYLDNYGRIVVVGNRVSVTEAGRSVYAVSFSRFTKEEQNNAAGCILGAIEDGYVNPVVSKQYKLEEILEAHNHLKRSSKDKLVIVM